MSAETYKKLRPVIQDAMKKARSYECDSQELIHSGALQVILEEMFEQLGEMPDFKEKVLLNEGKKKINTEEILKKLDEGENKVEIENILQDLLSL